MKEPQQSITPREALIKAASCGWADDELCAWYCPATAETIIAWAKSQSGKDVADFETAFEQLVDEGLYFEIHHGVFDPPVYYCSYDPEFFEEISGGQGDKVSWKAIQAEIDEVYGLSTWRSLGLCAGQGREGPSDARWGPCLGTACCCFEDGSPSCTHDIAFAKAQRVRCRGCGESVPREALQRHIQQLLDKEGRAFTSATVCSRCSRERIALIRVARSWKSWVDLDRTLSAFDKTSTLGK